MKDGREADFDSSGRVTKIWDSTHLNVISFNYSGNQAVSIVDTMGKTVSFAPAPNSPNNIGAISVSAGVIPELSPMAMTVEI